MKYTIETIIASIISGILLLFLFIFSSLTYEKLQVKDQSLDKYKTNWNLKPILEITKTNELKCPDQTEPLISTVFPGTYRGCNCMYSKKEEFKDEGVYMNFCEEKQLKKDCFQIKERLEDEITVWKKTQLCALKKPTISFSKIIKNDYQTACKQGTKQCGYIDSEKNLLCIDEGEECPINFIEIIPNEQVPSFTEDIKEIELEDGVSKLCYSNKNINGKIVIEVRINGDQNVCAYPNEGNFGENDFVLNKKRGLDHCDGIIEKTNLDERYDLIDTDKIENTYTDNDLIDLSTLPGYPLNAGKRIGLSTANYLGIKKECYNGLINAEKLSEPHFNKIKTTAMSAIILIIFDFLIVFVGFIFYRIYKSEWNKAVIIIIDIIDLILLFMAICFAISSYTQLKSCLKNYDVFQDNLCGDEIASHNFKYAYKDLIKSKKFSLTLLIVLIINFILKLGYCIFFYLTKKNEL